MSNTAYEILGHYQGLQSVLGLEGVDLPPLSACVLDTDSDFRSEMTDAGHVRLWQAIRAFEPRTGWLCFQSVVQKVEGGQLPEPDNDTGWLLKGELVNGQNESFHIWQDGGEWRITRFTEGVGDNHFLVQDAELLSVEDDQKTDKYLNYRVYWRHDEASGFQRYCSRFTGFATRRRKR